MLTEFTRSQIVGQEVASCICHLLKHRFDFSHMSNYVESDDRLAEIEKRLGKELPGTSSRVHFLTSNAHERRLAIWLEKDVHGWWSPIRAEVDWIEHEWLGRVDGSGMPNPEPVSYQTEMWDFERTEDGWVFHSGQSNRKPLFDN